MTDNTLDAAPRVEPAPRGSKAGWVTVSGQVPPAVADRLDRLEVSVKKARTDLVHDAILLLLDSQAAA